MDMNMGMDRQIGKKNFYNTIKEQNREIAGRDNRRPSNRLENQYTKRGNIQNTNTLENSVGMVNVRTREAKSHDNAVRIKQSGDWGLAALGWIWKVDSLILKGFFITLWKSLSMPSFDGNQQPNQQMNPMYWSQNDNYRANHNMAPLHPQPKEQHHHHVVDVNGINRIQNYQG